MSPSENVARAMPPIRRRLLRVLPFILIVSLFFLWGMANNLNDVLVAQFKKVFTLSDLQSGLVQGAFYMGYFLVALPAGIFMKRFGYKGAVIFGLVLYGIGAFLFWPAALAQVYAMFLLALFVIAGGLAFLETSANPFVTLLGPAETAAFRLNLAQAFNPLGSIAGVLIGQRFIFSGIQHSAAQLAVMGAPARDAYLASESAAVQVPYLVIGIVVFAWAAIIGLTTFPRASPPADELIGTRSQAMRCLLVRRHFTGAVIAQFFYVGAQVSVWSYMIRYVQFTMPGTPDKSAANFLTASLVCFMLGRFVGTGLMKVFRPAKLLALFALLDIGLAAAAVVLPGFIGALALVACSFFMSVMYPTIFALGIEGLGDNERKLGSSVLVMAIIGGAVLTAVMGLASDLGGIDHAMLVPLACFVAVLVFAVTHGRSRPQRSFAS